MLFKWHYNECPGMGRADTLMMGEVGVGEVFQTAPRTWRAICLLPDSSDWGNNFINDYHCKGAATGALESVCSKWLTKSGMWTVLGGGDTLPANNPEQG
ncbi:hypothetical protein GJ904_19905 [Salmonella enterica]|nr:hypothetical protein [Salmonella enterica subsp. enterica serovar Saintpaul]EEC1303329.1 hypothetical protein [Salmonella enterica]